VSAATDWRRRERDGCVVDAGDLAVLLRGFVARWNVERSVTVGRFAGRDRRTDVSPVGALKWLSAETGLAEGTIENIVRGRNHSTELRIADALVVAIGRPYAFHDGTLTIRPNPSAPAAARAACCSGSTLGRAGIHDDALRAPLTRTDVRVGRRDG
jgi:hypothetical protein